MQHPEDVEKLVTNEDFQAFCTGNAPHTKVQWQQWADERPKGDALLAEARELVDQLSLRLPATEVEGEYLKFKRAASRQDAEKRELSVRLASLKTRRWFAGIAATVLVLLFAGWFIVGQVEELAFKTTAGQTKEITLPDGSSVMLNANSELRFAETWSSNTTRKVWLSGEAFFSVSDSPTNGAPKFVVQTTQGAVTVVGTRFNVNGHQGRFEVVLLEGLVDLKTTTSTLKLLPGQRSWLMPNGELSIEKVDTEPYTAWKNGRLLFRDTPISRVADRLYDDFGILLHVPDQELLNKKVSANMKSGDPYALVEALAALYHLNLNASQDSLELTLTE